MTTDELFGLKPPRARQRKPEDVRLERRVRQLEKLPPRERRYILHMIDTALEREQLKRKIPA